MLAPRGGLPRLPRTGQVRMLGNFDTYLLGWKDREFSVTGEHAAARQGGGRRLDPPGDRRGRDRRRRLALVAEGRPAGDHPQPAEAERERLRSKIDAEVADIARFEGIEATIPQS